MFGIGRKPQKRSLTTVSTVSFDKFTEMLQKGSYGTLADNPDVQAAVNVIANLVSSMSLHLMKNSDKGDERINNELSRLIDVNPSRGMTRKMWLTKIVRDLYLYGDGNSLSQILVQPGSDYLSELRPIDMSKVAYVVDDDSNAIAYRVGDRKLSADQVVHFAINPDPMHPRIGTGYRHNLRQVLDNLAQAAQTKATFMSGRYMPNLIIKVDGDVEELATDEGRSEVLNKYFGSTNSAKPWVVPADMLEVQEVKPLTLQDIALNESIEMDKRTVAGMFGIPAFLLGVGEFNREEYNNFVNTTIAGLGQSIAQALTRDVVISNQWYFRFNPRSLFRYDLAELTATATSMLDRNAMSRNEARDWLGLPPRDDMEELLALENYLPVDKLGDQSKLKGGDEDGTTDESDETS